MKCMKKAIALLLTVLMVAGLSIPAFAAIKDDKPIIYVTGAQTNNIFNEKGERVYPLGLDAGEIIKEAFMPCLEELLKGMVINDYSKYAQAFTNALLPVYEQAVCDKNGDVLAGTAPQYHSSTVAVSKKTSNYGIWDYRFWYDWRESPLKSAEELKNYIERVKTATGKDKVNLIGRCYGANVIAAYIELYPEHAKANLNDVAYHSSSALGIDFMSALFAGKIDFSDKEIRNFVRYYVEYENLIEDEALKDLVFALVDIFERLETIQIAGFAVEKLIGLFKDDLIPLCIRSTMGSWPSYWAMVTPELYEEARDFIFGGVEDEYAQMIQKIDAYHNTVQGNIENRILDVKESGVNFLIFSKYNFPEFPVYDGSDALSDSYTTVYRQSFGATAAPYGTVLSEEYIASLSDSRFLSKDLKIDASTCLLPETSWFIKDLNHSAWDVLNEMTLDILRNDYDVFNDVYPQFVQKVGTTAVPIEGPDEDATPAKDSLLKQIYRAITALFTLIINAFKSLFTA